MRSAPRLLASIVLLAIAVRLALVLWPGLPAPGLYEDAYIAFNLVAGEGYSQEPLYGPTAVKAPAYPLLLAFVATFTADDGTFVRFAGVVNALLGGLACWMIARAARSLFDPTTGLLSALVVAVHPPHAYLARIPESTNLSLALAAATLAALADLRRQASRRRWFVAGVLGGLGGLANPLILPGLVLALVALGRRRPRNLLVAGLAIVLVFAPWTLRNRLVLGQWIVTKSPLWLDIYAGFVPENLGGRQVLPDGMRERIDARALGHRELEREAIYREEMLPWMLDNPGIVLRTAAWRLGQYFGLYGRRPQLGVVGDGLFRVLPEAAVLALALVGLTRALRRDRGAAALLLVFWLSYVAAYTAIVAVNIRYHLEILWVEAILAACALRPRTAEPSQTSLRR